MHTLPIDFKMFFPSFMMVFIVVIGAKIPIQAYNEKTKFLNEAVEQTYEDPIGEVKIKLDESVFCSKL